MFFINGGRKLAISRSTDSESNVPDVKKKFKCKNKQKSKSFVIKPNMHYLHTAYCIKAANIGLQCE